MLYSSDRSDLDKEKGYHVCQPNESNKCREYADNHHPKANPTPWNAEARKLEKLTKMNKQPYAGEDVPCTCKATLNKGKKLKKKNEQIHWLRATPTKLHSQRHCPERPVKAGLALGFTSWFCQLSHILTVADVDVPVLWAVERETAALFLGDKPINMIYNYGPFWQTSTWGKPKT